MRKVEIILFSKSLGICEILYYCYGEFIFDHCFKISLLDLRMKNSHFKKTIFFHVFFSSVTKFGWATVVGTRIRKSMSNTLQKMLRFGISGDFFQIIKSHSQNFYILMS